MESSATEKQMSLINSMEMWLSAFEDGYEPLPRGEEITKQVASDWISASMSRYKEVRSNHTSAEIFQKELFN